MLSIAHQNTTISNTKLTSLQTNLFETGAHKRHDESGHARPGDGHESTVLEGNNLGYLSKLEVFNEHAIQRVGDTFGPAELVI